MDNSAQPYSSSQNYQANPSQILGKAKSGFSGSASQANNSTSSHSLAVLEEVLDEVEAGKTPKTDQISTALPQRIAASGMVAQAVPKAVDEATGVQQSQQTGSTLKEAQGTQVFESIPGSQMEYEDSPEIAPDVEAFVKKVEEQDQLPQEIAVNINDIDLSQPQKLAKKAVVVLPITPEVEKVGARKSPKHSVRWLVEFARKIMKMFSGEVIYKDVPDPTISAGRQVRDDR